MRLSFKLLAVTLSIADAQAARTDTGVLDPGRSAAGGDRRLDELCSEGFVTCVEGLVEGSTETCESACGGACCSGNSACDRFTGNVCKDNKSCNGAFACANSNIGTVVNGCYGIWSCASTTTIASVENACNAYMACATTTFPQDTELSGCCNDDDYACYEFSEVPDACSSGGDGPAPPPAGPYHLDKSGDCTTPLSQLECAAAAAALDLPFQPNAVNKKKMPGGCFAKTNNEKGIDVKVRWNEGATEGTNCGNFQGGKFSLSCVCGGGD